MIRSSEIFKMTLQVATTGLRYYTLVLVDRSIIKMSSDTIFAVSQLDAQRAHIVNHMLLLAQLHVAEEPQREMNTHKLKHRRMFADRR